MEKVRIYTICYRKGARRHYDSSKCNIKSGLAYVRDTNLIYRYRVQIVTGDNKTLLFDSASLVKCEPTFKLMYNEGYGSTCGFLAETNKKLLRDICKACQDNVSRNRRYKTHGYLSTDKYCKE